MVIVRVLGWVLAALAGLLVYRLTIDRGRLLLQIERLEQRFAEVVPPPPDLGDLGLPVGAPAPDFELPDLDGTQHTLSEWRGTAVLLIFFDPECHFCRELAPRLGGRPRDRGDNRPFPLIVTARDREANRRLFADNGIDGPILLQDGAEVAALFRAEVTPSAHLIDEHGAIASALALGAEGVLALLGTLPSSGGADGQGTASAAPAPPVSGRLRSVAESKLNRSGLAAGTPAPQFTLPRLDGGDLSLAEYRGQQVLLVFSDPACAPCNLLAPRLERLHRRSPTMQVVMVSRGTLDDNRAKAAEFGLTFPIAVQRHWEVSRAYGMFATPIAYLIDAHGILASDVAVGIDAILDLATARRGRGEGRKEVTA